jgi:DNA-binding transcriptional MerR regulator
MSDAGARRYRVREFATMAGVTVRALHHYDRIGLLTPARSETGSRIYSGSDLQVLVQIVALKSVGVPLKRIGALCAHGPSALVETLGMQRRAVEHKQPAIDGVIFAVRSIEAVLNQGEEADPAVLRPLMDALRSGKAEHSRPAPGRPVPGWAELSQEWQALLAAVERTPAGDANDAASQDLARRWEQLMALSTDGAPYARDLVHHVNVLRSSATDGRVPGGALFDKIGTALAGRVERDRASADATDVNATGRRYESGRGA